ncbi:MAG TPA: hypothetical protein VD994_18175 [Prosthecobacter sp.]|nr:hypothetical protein [Prosthecobacter sp.]
MELNKYLRKICCLIMALAWGAFAELSVEPEDWNEIESRLLKGDYRVLEELKAANRLDELYRLSKKSNWLEHKEQMPKIVEAAKECLISIPHHATYIGDKVEDLTLRKGDAGERQGLLMSLQRIGTPEAVAQLGRFLDDKRNPELEDWSPQQGIPPPEPNYMTAAWGIAQILKDKLPFEMQGGYNERRDLPKVRAWWKSDAAEPYRRLLAESGRTRSETPALPTAAREASAAEPAPIPSLTPVAEAAKPKEERSMKGIWEWALGLVIAGALVVWLRKRRQ